VPYWLPLWLLLLELEGRVCVDWLLDPLVCDMPTAGIRSEEAIRIVVNFGYFM